MLDEEKFDMILTYEGELSRREPLDLFIDGALSPLEGITS